MRGTAALVEQLAAEIASGARPPGSRLPSVRAFAAEAGCAPGTVARAYTELKRRGLVEARERSATIVARAGSSHPPVRLAGSDDPALDLVLRQAGSAIALTQSRGGSLDGLARLARGEADAGALHLRHAESGRYNDPFVRGLPSTGEPLVLVHLWRRVQGVVLAPGNPRGVAGPRDLAGLRLAWRQAGSGSRLLLEGVLRRARVEPAAEHGDPERSHLAVGASVAAGASDAGVAVRAVAVALDLEFVPIAIEPCELVVRESAVDALAPLIDAARRLRTEIAALGGYDLDDLGRVRRPV
jgi:putative molybdopterin biosynthesis protein